MFSVRKTTKIICEGAQKRNMEKMHYHNAQLDSKTQNYPKANLLGFFLCQIAKKVHAR